MKRAKSRYCLKTHFWSCRRRWRLKIYGQSSQIKRRRKSVLMKACSKPNSWKNTLRWNRIRRQWSNFSSSTCQNTSGSTTMSCSSPPISTSGPRSETHCLTMKRTIIRSWNWRTPSNWSDLLSSKRSLCWNRNKKNFSRSGGRSCSIKRVKSERTKDASKKSLCGWIREITTTTR